MGSTYCRKWGAGKESRMLPGLWKWMGRCTWWPEDRGAHGERGERPHWGEMTNTIWGTLSWGWGLETQVRKSSHGRPSGVTRKEKPGRSWQTLVFRA